MSRERGKATQPKTWVLVADHARARLFTAQVPEGPLQEVENLVDEQARLHDSDIVADAKGCLVGGRRSAHGGGHAAGDEHAAKRQVGEEFAKRISERLHQAHTLNAMARLYLAAEPGFLGLLRQQLDPATRHLVTAEIHRRLTDLTAAQIREQLPAIL